MRLSIKCTMSFVRHIFQAVLVKVRQKGLRCIVIKMKVKVRKKTCFSCEFRHDFFRGPVLFTNQRFKLTNNYLYPIEMALPAMQFTDEPTVKIISTRKMHIYIIG